MDHEHRIGIFSLEGQRERYVAFCFECDESGSAEPNMEAALTAFWFPPEQLEIGE